LLTKSRSIVAGRPAPLNTHDGAEEERSAARI
jgi:hypothetical protein